MTLNMDIDLCLDGVSWLAVFLAFLNAVVAWLELHQGLMGLGFTIFMGLSTRYLTRRRILALEKLADQ